MKTRDLLHSAWFLAIAGAFALISVGMPAGGAWGGWVPDLTPVPVFFFLTHRPERVSMTAVFAVGLFADLLFGRVPGLGALALLVAGEAARGGLAGPLSETALGRGILLAAFCATHSALLSLSVIPAGGLSLSGLLQGTLHQAAWSTASYLPVSVLLRHGLRIRAVRIRALFR